MGGFNFSTFGIDVVCPNVFTIPSTDSVPLMPKSVT